ERLGAVVDEDQAAAPEERPVVLWRGEVEDVLGGDEDLVHLEVIAGRTAQAGGVPRVVHGDLLARHEEGDHAVVALVVLARGLAAALVEQRLAGEVRRVRGARCEGPAPGDRVAGVRGDGAADGPGGAGEDAAR